MSRYRKIRCVCGDMVTTNALGKASHNRACKGSGIARDSTPGDPTFRCGHQFPNPFCKHCDARKAMPK